MALVDSKPSSSSSGRMRPSHHFQSQSQTPEAAPAILTNTHLPPAVTSFLESNHHEDQLDDGNTIIGGILQDTKHAWLSNGSKFTVININTGQKIAAWTFGATLRDFKAKVTCVCELPVPLIENTMQLLIGLECELIGGMVCLFHCNGSRVLRAIQVDCQVICMQYIEEMPGSPLDCFDGAVLIGTHGGATLILDLNRHSCTEAILNSASSSEGSIIKDELNVANLVVLSIDNIDLIVEQRAIALRKDHHIAIQINEGCIHNLQFILHNPDNTIKHQVERENVYVTSVVHVPQLMSVIIGLNIGAFQLWNLITLQLEFTSRVNGDGLPITHIAFLEPCDDPRAFCYIWIVHSVLDRHEDNFPLATMYSLTYQEKQMISENQYLYEHFLSCNLRFNMELSCIDGSNNFSRNFTGGRCISCQSLIKTTNKEDADEYVLNICQIVWECWTVSAISPVQSMMILFDIDQWYKEHMPDCSMLQTNNYMSVVNLGDTLSHTASSYLCDVKINSETLTSYFSVQRLEEHFYPNALGYECFCLTNTDITKLLTMGIQRQLLASINQRGASILLHPTKIFQQCMNSGLIPTCIELPPSINIPESTQRQMLLSIALEARLIQFLGKCACDWATGSHTSIGCTLQLLLDWSWSRALSLKQNGDRVTVMFFNHSGEMPDRNTIQQLDNCVRQLGHIASLYNIILDKCTTYLLTETIKEIQQRQKVIQIVAQYFQVIQWFLNVGLLPEFHLDQLTDNINDRLPYPIDSLTEFYQNRRLKLHCLNGENPSNEDLANKSCKLLFIDQFIKLECSEKTLKSMWIEDQSTINGLYPPPSLHSLLKIYLIPEIKEEHKHSLLLYTLIDYAMIFDSERYENVIRRLMQFPTMFGLSNTAIKVTQAFWHLDHRDFQLALNQLQCVLAGGCLSQWQHNVVLSSLLVQKKTQSALQYLHVRKPCLSNDNDTKIYDDWEACSNLYLSRGLVYEAFNLNKDAMKTFPQFIKEERFIVFLNGCKKMGLLPKVLSLPLTNFEENIFVKFLKSIDDPYSSDILVMYYLNRSRYIEAQKVNEELKRLTVKNQLPYDETKDFSMKKKHIYKTETRDQLVDLYCKTLPPITRQLANFASNHSLNRKAVVPAPMTVSVQLNTPKPALYKSTIIQASIDKASETWLDKSCVVRGIKRLYQVEETPFLCTPKLTRSTSVFCEKMIMTPEETPSKKSKLDLSENGSPTNIENISPKLNHEIKVLLHTPTVKRQSKWNSISSQYSNETLSLQRESTPQSILKVRKLRERCIPSPLYERYLAETDDELETASQYTQSDNLSRSIRFKIPSRNNTPSPLSECTSDVQDSYIELCSKSNSNSEYSTKPSASPRKSIHYSCVDDIHTKETSFTKHSHRTSVATSLFTDDLTSDIIESNENIIQKSISNSNMSDYSPKKGNNDMSYVMSSPKPRRSLRLTNIQESSIKSAEKDKTISRTPEKHSMSRIITPSSKSKTITTTRKSFVNITHTSIVDLNDEVVINDSKSKNDSVKVSIGYDSILSSKNLESSYSKNITLPENISILCSDISEEIISDTSFTTARADDDIPERFTFIESKNSSTTKDTGCEIIDENSIQSSRLEEDHKLNESSKKLEISTHSPKECKVMNIIANEESDEDAKFEFQITNDVSLGESFSKNKNIDSDDALKEEAIIKDVYQIDNEEDNFEYGENSSDGDDINAILHIDEGIEVIPSENIETVEEVEIIETEEIQESVIVETEPATEENVQKSSNIDNSVLNFSESLVHENSSDDFANKAYLDNSSAVLEVSSVIITNEDNNSQNKTVVETIYEPDSKFNTSASKNIVIVEDHETQDKSPEKLEDKTSISKNLTTIENQEIQDRVAEEIENETSTSKNIIKIDDHKIQDEVSEEIEIKDDPQETCIEVSITTCEVPADSEGSSVIVSPTLSPVSKLRKRSITDSKTTAESDEGVTSTPLKKATSKTKGPKTPNSTKKSKSTKSLDDSDNDSVTSEYSSRRSTRSTSKLDASFVSDSSLESEQSARRKSRRSILAAVKPNLSVIPEMSHTEDDKSMMNKTNLSRRKDSSHTPIDLDLYSSSRRLTRHQKSLLEKSMDYSSVEKEMPNRTIRGSVISEVDENSDNDSVSTNYTSETLDPILLLDKNDFRGQPDPEENAPFSRESSVFSNRLEVESGNQTKENTPDSSRSRPSKRSKRLLSEIRESPSKSISLAVASTSVKEEMSVESPSTRLRRQSFNKAVEALSTPRKSRRLSTDSRKSEVNTPTAEIEETKTDTPKTEVEETMVTPKRSLRRQKAASVHGELSVSNLDDVATPVAKGSRKSLFFTPLSKDKRMSFIEKEQKQKPSYKKKTGVHKIVQPIDFVLKKE